MKLYDCNLSYGRHFIATQYTPCPTIDELCEELANAGLDGGFVRCLASDTTGARYGNEKVAQEIGYARKQYGLDLYGAWALLPSSTREIPAPDKLPAEMAKNHIGALYMLPKIHRYLARPLVMGDYMAMAQERKIPVILDTKYGLTMDQICDMLEAYPKLTAVVACEGSWPNARQFYPLLEAFPNVALDLTYMWDDQGIEEIVDRYGADKLLLGSGFPERYLGGFIAYVRAAEISDEDKALIFGGNFERLVKEANLQ